MKRNYPERKIGRFSKFWAGFGEFLKEKGIDPGRIRWYEHWAREFAKAFPGIGLRSRTSDHVGAFFSNLQSNPSLQAWQIDQARDAVKLLLEEFLQSGDSPSSSTGQNNRPAESIRRPRLTDGPWADLLRSEIRLRHYSRRTESAYSGWIRDYLSFHGQADPLLLEPEAVRSFLVHLAEERDVAASTQNQALNALVFLYEQVFQRELGDLGDFTRAKKSVKVPVVLSRQEVGKLLQHLDRSVGLVGGLLYGSGLRLLESLRLRVKDVDFDLGQIVVRDGKGGKDRITLLPERYGQPLKVHLEKVRELHVKDLAMGLGVQELLGHSDVSTTMIYTHVLNNPGLAVKSPADGL